MANGATALALTFTGERVIPGRVEQDLWNEHISRYRFAQLFAMGKTVLDIGCGSGYGTALLAATAGRAFGFDISIAAVEYASAEASQAQFAVACASALPVPAESFNLLTAFELIEHVSDWRGVIKEAARALTPDGVFLVSTPNKHYYAETRAEVGPNPFHEHEFELDEFRWELERSFPFVRILGQNHQQAVVFSEGPSANEKAFIGELQALCDAHFFIAVCAKKEIDIPSFAYIPSAGNLLREREHYIRLLKAQLTEARRDHAVLLTAHRALNRELEQQNEWAFRLDRDLIAKTKVAARQASQLEKTTTDLEAAQDKANELHAHLESVRQSFWLRLGRKLDIGPWTESRFHLKQLRRWLRSRRLTSYAVSVWRFVSRIPGFLATVVLLPTAALVFAVEDLCFLCFGKRRLLKESAVSRQGASIVIPTWNGKTLLESYLPSVIEALSPNNRHEIILVDNASTDGSADFVREKFPGVRVLEMAHNLGFGGGSNAGVRTAVNDIVVLLNNDMQVDRNFLAPLLEPFADPLVFAVSSQIFFTDVTRRREETGLTEVWWEKGRLRASHRIDPEITVPYPCAYPGGGSSAFNRRKFLELGGFDPLYEPFYYEDTDLGYLAWKRGWKVLYQPASVVHHCHRATIGLNFSEGFVQGVLNKNAILYCWKNIHNWRMLLQHLGACLLDCIQSNDKKTTDQWRLTNLFSCFNQLRAAISSRWRAMSSKAIPDVIALKQPLGGYFRDRFIASNTPPPARLNVLFASPYPIEPPVHGGAVLMKQTLTQLALLADVHVVSFLDNRQQVAAQDALLDYCKSIHVMVREPVPKIGSTLTPYPVRQFAHRDFAWVVHRTMLLEQIDVVQIEYTMLGQYAGNYRHIPCMLFEHDIFSQSLGRAFRGGMSTESLLEYLRMRRYEPRLLARVTRVQVCSLVNAQYLKQLAPRVTKVDADLRAAIDINQYSPGYEERDFSKILFVGGFNHSPNVQALEWFIKEVFERILAVRPDVMLEIVGANPPAGPSVWEHHPNIQLIGAVEDVRLPLSRSGVFICPILHGSGVRVKLLEAFASGIPVVSTSIGAEGLASRSGVVCELADTPDEFAHAVLLLLQNKPHRRKLAERARLLVEQEWNSRLVIPRLETSYRTEVCRVRSPDAAFVSSA